MPTLSEAHDEYIDKDQTPFIGEPAKVIDSANKEGEEGENEAEAAQAEDVEGEEANSQAERDSNDTD